MRVANRYIGKPLRRWLMKRRAGLGRRQRETEAGHRALLKARASQDLSRGTSQWLQRASSSRSALENSRACLSRGTSRWLRRASSSRTKILPAPGGFAESHSSTSSWRNEAQQAAESDCGRVEDIDM